MRINPKVVSDRFEDETVVVNLENGIYYSFKNTAMDVWANLETGLPVEMIPQAFQAISDGQKEAINGFIQFLTQENLLLPSEGQQADIRPLENTLQFAKLEFVKFEDMTDLIMTDPIHEVDDQTGWPNKPNEEKR